jgi:hypothetical protein
MSKRAKKLQRISRRLTTHQLRKIQEKDLGLDSQNLFLRDDSNRGSPFLLGFYSHDGIRYALEKYGFFDYLKDKGFSDLKLTINTSDPYKQRIAVYYREKKPESLLGEVVVKRRHLTVYPPFPALIFGRNFDFVAVEWLSMQNPQANFTPDKPRLPGQKYPGLGMGEMVMEILAIMAGRLRTAGLLNVPEYFHNAQIYSSQFKFIDPVYEAKRLAISRDLLNLYPLSKVSWAIELGCVLENDTLFQWKAGEQIIPLDRDLKDYFKSHDYRKYVEQETVNFIYRLDETKWMKKAAQIEKIPAC